MANSCDYTVEIVRQRKTSQKKRPEGQPRAAARMGFAAPWRLRASGGLKILELIPWTKLPWLAHGFSTRVGGASILGGEKVLNLSFTEWDTNENVQANRRALQKAVGGPEFSLAALRQIHSDVIHAFCGTPGTPCKGDASITNTRGLLLATQTADCVPVLMVDLKKRAVAAIHAGWRGTLGRIAQKAVGRMQMEFASKPADLLAAIGPSIGPCCYEVAADFVTKFTAQFPDAREFFDEARTGDEPNPLQWLNMKPPGHQPPPKNVHLDLWKANRSQLLAAGLRETNIYACNLCTACRRELFFSYRKEAALSGRMMSVIGVR